VGSLPTNLTVSGFAVERANAKTMYSTLKEGLFKSTDGGETWKRLTKSPKNLGAVTINPNKPMEIYAATVDGIIFFSADAGTTWRKKH